MHHQAYCSSTSRPFLRLPSPPPPPPSPPPFVLPSPKNKRIHALPAMILPPPPKPKTMVRKYTNDYTKINHQLFARRSNLALEFTFTACSLGNQQFPSVEPFFRVHGLRICVLEDDGTLISQSSKPKVSCSFLRVEESEAARMLILKDLEENNISVDDLGTKWFDDYHQDPVMFWIKQFLKHGYFVMDDPLVDYTGRVAHYSGPVLVQNSLGRYLVRMRFEANNYHNAERYRTALLLYFHSTPFVTFIEQDGHMCAHEISVLRVTRAVFQLIIPPL